ncbi:MAG: YibE/F family protein [bacterium]|nr:YibE/F family protein [bacterium]
MLRKSLSVLLLFFLFFFVVPIAQAQTITQAESVKARVTRILDERTITRENGDVITQQNVELVSLGGTTKGETLEFKGISTIDVVSSRLYKAGDIVFVSIEYDEQNNRVVYITDFVRERGLIILVILFVIVVGLIGGKVGWRSLLALVISFMLILEFLAPLILAGYNPIIIGPIATILILAALIYITDGFNRKAHIAMLSIFVALIITFLLSWLFVNLTRLSGTSSEEVIYLIGDNIAALNFQGLLLAAIIIGALGVLDDIAIGQIEAVEQLRLNNPNQSKVNLFKSAMTIGRAHLGAIINTLFLAYVGASLPLILLFKINSAPFLSFSQVINHEEIATEIVRGLVGVIGLCLTMPIATVLAVWLLFDKKGESVKA